MFKNLPPVSLRCQIFLELMLQLQFLLILRINFAKIHTDSEVVLLITLLFGRMLSLVKRFH